MKKLKTLLSTRIQKHIARHGGEFKEPAFPIALAAHHMVVTLIGLIEGWLDHELQLSIEGNGRHLPAADHIGDLVCTG